MLPHDFALQRRARGDGRKWRTVVRFSAADAPIAQRGAALLSGVDDVAWRVVTSDRWQIEVARLDGGEWVAVDAARS